jgi:hypothetical protein
MPIEALDVEFTDRYSGTGIPYPDPDTICIGQCEGMGCVPVFIYNGIRIDEYAALISDETNPELIKRWHEAEAVKPTDDGWHFVICPDCEGTRVRPGVPVTGPIIGRDILLE